MKQKELEKQVRKFSKNIKAGDKIIMKYKGETIATYEFIEWSIDSKSPIDWLRGCLIFQISLKARDINKVELDFVK